MIHCVLYKFSDFHHSMTPPCAAPAEELPKTSFSGALRLMRLKKGDVTRGKPKVRPGFIFVLCVPNQDICSPKIKAFIVASFHFLHGTSIPVFQSCACPLYASFVVCLVCRNATCVNQTTVPEQETIQVMIDSFDTSLVSICSAVPALQLNPS